MDKAEVVNKAKKFSKRAKQILAFNQAFLYGSYVNGNPREDSDIDIGIFVNELNNSVNYYNLLVKLHKLASKIDCRIEPHIFINNSGSGFGEVVRLNGEEIKL